MLAGRESLARLVGKRRPNLLLARHHLLLSPPDEAPRTADPVLDWATCPVCRSRVRGSDPEVNAHLDLCLAKGTKRKLTQSTLLQFCQKPKSKTGPEVSDTIKADFRKPDSDENNASSADPFLLDSRLCDSSCEQNIVPQLEWHPLIIAENDVILEKNLGLLDGGDPPCSSITSSNDVHEPQISNAKDTFPKTLLETVIVGHRYHNKNQLSEGAAFLVVRDHENTKDKNALKVLSSESGEMLGYLPKELAKHLSLLIDKYHFKLEGSVTSMPKHDLDGVPVQLLCERMVPWSEMDVHDVENVNSLLENALQVVGLEKAFAPNMTKYQKNFHIMIQEVLKRHDHLFTDAEKSFLEYFGNLSDDSQRLLIRLYTRKGPWFRASNISYAEVQDSAKAIEDLQLAGYICSFLSTRDSSESAISEVLDLLTVVELREIVCLVLSKKGTKFTRKKELVDTLSAAYVDGTCKLMENLVTERAGTCIRISAAAESLLWRIQRLFFLNGEQDLSSFLLVDLGMVKYPSYMCNISKAIFRDRDDFLKYEEAIAVGQIMDESVEENDGEMVNRCLHFSDGCISPALDSSPTFLSCFSASWVYSKVVTLGVSFCERERRYEDAVKFLRRLLKRISCGGKRGYWTLRLSIDLEHMGYTNESLSVAEEGMGDPWVRAGSRVALQRRILRLGRPPRRWKVPSFAESINRKIKEVHIRGRPLNCETGTKNRYYGYNGAQCGVEELALQYYAGEGGGWKGTHAEGGIWLTIFGLLMWDIIFSDVPDVFQTKFQTSPLDLGTDSFYLSRKELIESQLLKIQDGMAEEILICSRETHFKTACRGVNWDRHPLEDLRAIVSCVNGHCLASLCRHLSQDYRSWSSGLPDLLLWQLYEDGRGGEAKLVEVKGPRDRLSEQQRAWILILMDCGFDVEICRVSPTPKSK